MKARPEEDLAFVIVNDQTEIVAVTGFASVPGFTKNLLGKTLSSLSGYFGPQPFSPVLDQFLNKQPASEDFMIIPFQTHTLCVYQTSITEGYRLIALVQTHLTQEATGADADTLLHKINNALTTLLMTTYASTKRNPADKAHQTLNIWLGRHVRQSDIASIFVAAFNQKLKARGG